MSLQLARRSALSTRSKAFMPNMTPMVDVVMVILVFFMASTALLGPEWLVRARLPRPGPSTPTETPPTRVVLRLTIEDGATVVRVGTGGSDAGAPVLPRDLDASLRGLLGTLPTSPKDLIVVIEPDASVPYEDVVLVHATCERLGLEKAGLRAPQSPTTTDRETTDQLNDVLGP